MTTTERLKQYIDYKEVSLTQFDKSIGAGTGYIGKQIKRNASIGSEMIEKIICTYTDLSPLWLITGKGNMIYEDKLGNLIEKANKFVPKSILELAKKNAESEKLSQKIAPKIAPNDAPNTQKEVIYEGRQNIIMVNHKVAAGFALIVHNNEQLQALPRFTVPQLAHKMGTFYCFPVSGDSMHPTVKHKEWVIVEQREGISDIKGGHVYMICTHEGLCLKRLYYKTGEKHIKCVSDNETYVPYKEDVVNVLGIYEAIIHFSDDFRNWNNDVRTSLNTAIERITALEQKVFGKK